jgi:hypothetical protein
MRASTILHGPLDSISLRLSILTVLCYTATVTPSGTTPPTAPTLRLLPAYLGTSSIEEAVRTARGRRVLWLEILVNDRLDLTPWSSEPAVQAAYLTACRWYTHYRRLITFVLNRAPLPTTPGPIDARDYRTFAEALYFAYSHP